MTPRPKHPENKTQTRSAVSPARELARKPARARSSECHELVVPREGTRTSCQLSYRGSDEFRQQYERAGILCRLSYRGSDDRQQYERAGILCRLSYRGSDEFRQQYERAGILCRLSYRGSDDRQQYERAGILCRLSYRGSDEFRQQYERAGILCRLSHWGSDTNAKVDIIYIIRRYGFTAKRTKLRVYGWPSAPVMRLESPLPGDLLSGFSLRREVLRGADGQRALPFETRSRMEFVELAVPTA